MSSEDVQRLPSTSNSSIKSRSIRKQVHFSEMSLQSIHPTVLHFNCGGTVIEITRETLELYPKSLLCDLAKQCPENAEVFIDRDPYGLKTIVDYLHCGTKILYTECATTADAEFLEKEAEYYGFEDIALKCASLYNFKYHSEVSWRPEVIDSYYPLFAKCIVDPTLMIPFTYERNSHLVARCIACEDSYEPKQSHVFVFNVHEWAALKHHMHIIIGVVEKIIGTTCLIVRWSNGVPTHIPRSALRVVIDDL